MSILFFQAVLLSDGFCARTELGAQASKAERSNGSGQVNCFGQRQLLMEEYAMARAVFPHEVTDPDFQWLLNSYCEAHPSALRLESSCMPVVLIKVDEPLAIASEQAPAEEVLPPPLAAGEAASAPTPKK